jgi:hypothetical protein
MEKETYTIQEVISLITSLPFQKFSHPYFSDDEYIYGDGAGHLCDENGYQLPQGEFWNLRMNTMKDGWFMVEEKNTEDNVVNSNTTDMTEAEIQELYKNAKDIIRKMPDKIINVSKFNIYQPDVFGRDEHRERVDYVQLIKNKLVFMSEYIINGQPWVAHLSHLDAKLRREVLKQILKTYGKQN